MLMTDWRFSKGYNILSLVGQIHKNAGKRIETILHVVSLKFQVNRDESADEKRVQNAM